METQSLQALRDNIALGDPERFHDDARVHAAARLGGAAAFVERLQEKYETYLDRPVRDYFSGMPEGTRTLFGRQIDFAGVRGAGGMASRTGGPALSGGEMQRIALAIAVGMRSAEILLLDGTPSPFLLMRDIYLPRAQSLRRHSIQTRHLAWRTS